MKEENVDWGSEQERQSYQCRSQKQDQVSSAGPWWKHQRETGEMSIYSRIKTVLTHPHFYMRNILKVCNYAGCFVNDTEWNFSWPLNISFGIRSFCFTGNVYLHTCTPPVTFAIVIRGKVICSTVENLTRCFTTFHFWPPKTRRSKWLKQQQK